MKKVLVTFAFASLLASSTLSAETWSSTAAYLQLGELELAGTGGNADVTVFTLEHSGGWEYGSNFFFIDHSRYSVNKNSTNFPVDDSSEFYGEWYSNFSLGAITGNEIKFGLVKDIGLIAGVNMAPEVDSMWLLPGVRFSLDLPGFTFAQVDFTSYIHQGGGSINSPVFTVLDEETSFMVDFSWGYPFKLGSTSWSIGGHLEYINGRQQTSNFGNNVLESWVLFQPQLRLDLGELMGNSAGKVFVGVKYQYWKNKLGEKGTDDNAAMLIAGWTF
jgi:nucleoside-specific outer membrane channel protein Tsx